MGGLLLAGLLLAASVGAAQRAGPHRGVDAASEAFTVVLSRTANLAYQLDCLAAVTTQCGVHDFSAWWHHPTRRRADDSLALARWAEVRSGGDGAPRSLASAPDASLEALADAAAGHHPAALRTSALASLQHFAPRFDAWWDSAAPVTARRFVDPLRQLLERTEAQRTIADMRVWFGTPGRSVHSQVVLFIRPGVQPDPSNGGQAGDLLMMEVLPADQPADVAEIALHEYAHLLFATRTPAQQRLLRHRLVSAGGAVGVSLANLLNEGLATALANGRWARTYLTPAAYQARLADSVGLYARPVIHRAARVLLTTMDRLGEDHGAIDHPRFVRTLLAVALSQWPDVGTTLDAVLHDFVLVTDENAPPDLVRAFARTFRPVSVHEVTVRQIPSGCTAADRLAARYRDYTVVLVYPRPWTGASGCGGAPAPWTWRRGAAGAARLYVNAIDRAALEPLLTRLRNEPTGPADGGREIQSCAPTWGDPRAKRPRDDGSALAIASPSTPRPRRG